MDVSIHKDAATWDAFVESSADAWNYHRWVWKDVIEETYGHESLYLSACHNGTLQGILPLFFISSRLFGKFLVSIPFFSYCGVIARTDEARNALLASAVEHARSLGARYIELRQAANSELEWQRAGNKVRMQVLFPEDPDAFFQSLDRKVRNIIRRRASSGFHAAWDGIDAVDTFYPIFAVNMRNLGTPVYPKEWFLNMCRKLPGEVRILTIWEGRCPVAGALLTAFRETLENPWSASLFEARSRGAGMWLEWKMLEGALENGYRRMDLGRSTPGSGSYNFKKQWTNHETPLRWYRWPASAARDQSGPEKSGYRMAIQLWKHLPLPIANRLGPLIVRSIP